MKILTVVGARPQFIKAAPVSKAFKKVGIQEYLVHTGQHYDYGMSKIFFEELQIPEPDVNLSIGSGSHGYQTGTMLIGLEDVIIKEKPDLVLVYGDTNSTLAGALAAVKLHIPVAHVEAGLRSFNREMPEEHNRVLTDHCSGILFCPTQSAVEQLEREGITQNVHFTGDVMYDAVLQFTKIAVQKSSILNDLQIQSKQYVLATLHRPSNTDNPVNLESILTAFEEIGMPVIFPVHPRTRQKIDQLLVNKHQYSNLSVIDPVGYLDMLVLEQNAQCILTDSGGVQKEAYFFEVPCITLRTETEWVETLVDGWNILVGADKEQILRRVHSEQPTGKLISIFGDGDAATRIVQFITSGK
jgi:UDP-GlcNAc3NAcA epimerase